MKDNKIKLKNFKIQNTIKILKKFENDETLQKNMVRLGTHN